MVIWVPEAPGHPGLYARMPGGTRNATFNIHEARQFKTRAECAEWIYDNKYPLFQPVQHIIEE